MPHPDANPWAEPLERLERSSFRFRRKLLGAELEQLDSIGMEKALEHATSFIEERLGPAHRPDDGRQTPYRGHPVFIAQHATATCCRGCLQTWHSIPRGAPLTPDETLWIVGLIGAWLVKETGLTAPPLHPPPKPRRRRWRQLELFPDDGDRAAA